MFLKAKLIVTISSFQFHQGLSNSYQENIRRDDERTFNSIKDYLIGRVEV